MASLRQNFNQSIGASIVALLCIVAIRAMQVPQLNRLINKANTTSSAELKREVETEKLRLNLMRRLPSFGFNNIVADWTFLNFLQYFGDDSARAKTGYTLSPDYFEVILERDPYFLSAYRFFSSSTTLFAGMPERTISLMDKNLKLLSPQVPPQSYYIWRYKGTDELLFLGNPQAARKSFETAAQWADTYADAESKNVSMVSRHTAQFLANNPESKSAQVNAWSSVLNNALDTRTRQLAISKIQSLGGQVSITPQGEVKIKPPKKD